MPKKTFAISLSNGALISNARTEGSKWDHQVSTRLQRALKKARAYRAAGERNVILWQIVKDSYLPVSLKPRDTVSLNNEALKQVAPHG